MIDEVLGQDKTVASNSRRIRAAVALVLALGAMGVSVQYFAQRSLWHDELAIARNIEDRSFAQLIAEPLDHSQTAPVGWLVAVKLSTTVVGVNELGLRLVPWLAGLSALFLGWRVSQRLCSGFPQVAVLAQVALGIGAVWHGSEAKQYSTDVAVVLLLMLLAMRFREHPDDLQAAARAGAVGAAALLLSFPAVPVAFVLGLSLAGAQWAKRDPDGRLPLLALGTGWGIGAGLMAWQALVTLDPGTRSYMRAFWAEGFPPPISAGGELLVWPVRQLLRAVGHYLMFLEPPPPLIVIPVLSLFLALAGVAFLALRDRLLLAIAVSPVLAGVSVAVAGLLPFRHRVALYAVPAVFLLSGAALQGIAALPGCWGRRVAHTLATLLLLPMVPAVAIVTVPLASQDARYVLGRVAAEWEEGDALYVSCRGDHAAAYYGPRSGIEDWTVASCDPEVTDEGLIAEIEALRSSRVWFFFTQSSGGRAQRMRELFAARWVQDVAIEDRFGLGGQSETAAYRYDLGGR